MEVEEEFEPAPEEMEGVGGPDARRTECFFSFALTFVSLFKLLAGRGERNWGAPLGLLDSAVAFYLLVILYFTVIGKKNRNM